MYVCDNSKTKKGANVESRSISEQAIAWVAVGLNDFPRFPKASRVVDALHGWEMTADDALRWDFLSLLRKRRRMTYTDTFCEAT